MKAAFTREAAVGVILVIGLAVHQAILVTDAGLQRRKARAARGTAVGLGRTEALRSALDRAGMVILITLTSMASLIPLAIGTSTQDIFGAIALATAGGTVFGTLGAMFVVPALLVGRRPRRGAIVAPPLEATPTTSSV
jgi:multidrug efflux pump subunit AcrB